MTLLADVKTALRRRLPGAPRVRAEDFWEARAQRHGRRAVLDLRQPDFEAATRRQQAVLYPLFQSQLTGSEQLVLDLGCGPGRFTADLARLIDGRAIGLDPTEALLELAPESERLSYHRMESDEIALPQDHVDVIWICLVLGGIPDDRLPPLLTEVARVLRPGGLLFLVENTTPGAGVEHWKYRTVETYQRLCDFAALEHLDDYDDLGETISIMAGRQC